MPKLKREVTILCFVHFPHFFHPYFLSLSLSSTRLRSNFPGLIRFHRLKFRYLLIFPRQEAKRNVAWDDETFARYYRDANNNKNWGTISHVEHVRLPRKIFFKFQAWNIKLRFEECIYSSTNAILIILFFNYRSMIYLKLWRLLPLKL